MAQLTFNSVQGGGYEATATVNSNFNLHVERNEASLLTMAVSTVQDGAYLMKMSVTGQMNIDEDFKAMVFPKYIKIFSLTQPTVGYITESNPETVDETTGVEDVDNDE